MSCVLIVHHDADLYGADKSLLRVAQALQATGREPVVVLPRQGPLVGLLGQSGVEVHIGPVVKITRQALRWRALPALVAEVFRSQRFIARVLAGRRVALVYTNSVAALGGAIWAALHRVPRLWHVREIVVSPRLVAHGYPLLLRLLGGWCICNSAATRDWIIGAQPTLAARSSVIWNGLDADPASLPTLREESSAVRRRLGIGESETVVVLVGRINRWKGQGVLIDVAHQLAAAGATGVRFLIVGDVADGQVHFREEMLERVRRAGLADLVLWHPFTAQVDAVWAASDIAVVPSTEPEPFGRVAIEAMAHGLPVLAAAHGGLTEIVEHEVTGLLLPPGDVAAWAAALSRLVGDAETRRRFGEAGRQRQQHVFSQGRHDRALIALVAKIDGSGGEAP
jgi:glycosyltransferase involved in cell wall biosynthesis